ncbi:hypothetical protein D3C86_2141750 [compost metagenome]
MIVLALVFKINFFENMPVFQVAFDMKIDSVNVFYLFRYQVVEDIGHIHKIDYGKTIFS